MEFEAKIRPFGNSYCVIVPIKILRDFDKKKDDFLKLKVVAK